ncbi:unnamed protein product [Phytomonas sp. EM1]|nr:unnamed protein product [Phytomonas sp. EM1]|eukprot:CCW60147.1 unnamed protein product [Phytomonas sp. isolate EM1]
MAISECSKREKRRQKFGIDCNDLLVWKIWEPEQQYTRQVILKNIERDAQTISFKLPAHRNTFLTPFPESVTLRSGVSFTLDVTFCPLEVVEIHDSIEVTVEGKGSFNIKLEGRIPYAKLRCTPRRHDFKLCPVGFSTRERMSMTNIGTVPLEFVWDLPAPFAVTPQRGFLKPNEPLEAFVVFTPLDARPVFAQGVCRLASIDEALAVIELSGVGKYPHISFAKGFGDVKRQGKAKMFPDAAQFSQVSHTHVCVDFGAVATGSTQSYELVLENPSLVAAHVRVRREDDNVDCPFQLSLPNAEAPLISSPSSLFPLQSPGESLTDFEIPRNVKQSLIITYKAKGSAACRHTNVFELRAVAGNVLHVSATGMISTSHVCASTSYLNFGDVNLEKLSTRDERTCAGVVQLKNKGRFPTYFQIHGVTPGGAFSVEPSCGAIESRKSVYVKVHFHPTEPRNYLRRLFIFVQNMLSGTLFVDLFGSAYNVVNRPPPFGLQEVETFFTYMKHGLGFYTPRELDMLERAALGELENNSSDSRANSNDALSSFERIQIMWRLTKDKESFKNGDAAVSRRRAGSMTIDSMLRLLNHTLPCPFSLESKSILAFEFSEKPQSQTVIVRNDSPEAAIATWVVHKDSMFVVSPTQQEIPAGEQYTFQVVPSLDRGSNDQSGISSMTLSRRELGCAQVLECYVSYAQMRSFRNVDKHTFIPPHCFYVPCLLRCHPSVVPQLLKDENIVHVSSTITTFTATRVGGTTYQIISLLNLTDAFISYEISSASLHRVSEKLREGAVSMFISDEGTILPKARIASSDGQSIPKSAAVFACSPSTGWVGPQKRVLIVYCFHPTSYAQFEAEATLNAFCGRQMQSIKLRLLGESDVPRLVVTGASMGIEGRQFYLKPTCVTGESHHVLQLHNPTSLRIAYLLIPSPDLMGVLRFEPSEGILSGGERSRLTIFFKPEAVSSYKGSVTLLLRDTDGIGHEDAPPLLDATQSEAICGHSITWQVNGEGVYGKLEVEPTVMTLERGELNSSEEQTTANLTLYNSGRCELAYEVRVWIVSDPAALGEESPNPVLFNHTGTLPARAHCTVLVTPCPSVSGGVGEYILYAMIAGTADFSSIRSPETLEEVLEHPHCKLMVLSRRPAVQVVDVRSLTQPRSSLWRRLSINELNTQLAAPVHASDADPSFHAFHQYISGLMPIAMNIAVGNQHAPSARISLVLENTGDCEATFTVWLPTEADVNQETWFVEQEDLSDIQHIIDASLIDIRPRCGTIGIGDIAVMTITYRFCEIGTHVLPAMLRLSDGKRALILLEGRTMPTGMSCLVFHHKSSVYHLQPVMLGDMEPPMQSIMVENPLDREVTYTVDIDSILAIAERNYNFPILQCVAPIGTLAPCSLASVPWYFRPLEAIEYTMDVPIYTDAGESYTLTLIGRGYHPHTTPVREIRQWIDNSFFFVLSTAARGAQSRPLSLYEAPVSLSTEVMTFGAVPFYALYRRCCTLTNHHPTDVYSFKWSPSHTNGDHTLFINPKEGVIPPNGGTVMCRIAFNTGSVSQQLVWPILCMVTNKTVIDAEIQNRASEDAAVSSRTPIDGEECIAADGLGVFACGAATTQATRDGPQRSTFLQKKARMASPRPPVMNIPPESLSLNALSRMVAETRRQYEDNLLDLDDNSQRTVMYGTLELFLQARIMPVDYWELLYEQKAKSKVYQPSMHLYTDPQPIDSFRPATMEEVQVTRNVMDEIIHMIVAQPQTQSAFTQPRFAEEPVYYRDLVAKQSELTQLPIMDSSYGTEEVIDDKANQGKQASQVEEKIPPSGLLKCTLEVALDEMILDIATSVLEQI